MTDQQRTESPASTERAVGADAAAAPAVTESAAPYTGLDGAASFADAESREIMNLLGDGGSCCGGSCCAA
ncbi:hypothetical protein [Leucobacter chromiiresistens]|uniref:Uncharacterized protein n=1 Tax=Leucobacter chromiiresistens TaxID=1079994 RepID=A0A147ERQ6_9MICO|nr:hypothetical protein [Leucobacter chromiiresistens]KTR87166.1 hypothetical protein NS354_01350 [Leucobacter chromiiresistens]